MLDAHKWQTATFAGIGRCLPDTDGDLATGEARDSKIYRSTGGACNGADCYGWQETDDNPASIGIAARGANLFQPRRDGLRNRLPQAS